MMEPGQEIRTEEHTDECISEIGEANEILDRYCIVRCRRRGSMSCIMYSTYASLQEFKLEGKVGAGLCMALPVMHNLRVFLVMFLVCKLSIRHE